MLIDRRASSVGTAICQHRRENLCGYTNRHISWKREEELLEAILLESPSSYQNLLCNVTEPEGRTESSILACLAHE